MRTLAALLILSSLPVLAEEECRVEAGPNDVVKKTGNVVIEAGQTAEDAVALDGTVTVKKGATVKNAVSFHGGVVVEDGAKVTKTALAIGGTVKVAKSATVNSTVEVSDKGLRVRGEDGKDVDVNIVIGGKSLGQRIADEAMAKMKNCRIATK
ncbi:MAG: hypothetical protein Q8L48_27180 [Archangium sp.]|nr:hypothetical protein [Archangium sp.]